MAVPGAAPGGRAQKQHRQAQAGPAKEKKVSIDKKKRGVSSAKSAPKVRHTPFLGISFCVRVSVSNFFCYLPARSSTTEHRLSFRDIVVR
jgi:hypothetical protein